MEYLIGATLSLAVAILAAVVGLDRGRSFYPTVLIVIASYYVLFAAMGATGRTLVVEILAAGGFSGFALIGFKKSLWLIAIATVGHGIFDGAHHLFIDDPGVPRWWPGFCLAFDVVFGCFLAMRLLTCTLPRAD
jgi:hypothetical protein